MDYYLQLIINNYKAQLLISPPANGIYTVRARRSSQEDWQTVEHQELIAALFQLSNQLLEADQAKVVA